MAWCFSSIRWGIIPKPGLTYFFYDMNYLFITGSHFINLKLNQHLISNYSSMPDLVKPPLKWAWEITSRIK